MIWEYVYFVTKFFTYFIPTPLKHAVFALAQ